MNRFFEVVVGGSFVLGSFRYVIILFVFFLIWGFVLWEGSIVWLGGVVGGCF